MQLDMNMSCHLVYFFKEKYESLCCVVVADDTHTVVVLYGNSLTLGIRSYHIDHCGSSED